MNRISLLRLLAHVLPPLAALALFADVRGHDYVWDDAYLFVSNESLHHWNGLLSTLFQPLLPDTAYFRPLALFSFALEFISAGVDPGISHSINLALHLANTALVTLLASQVLRAAHFAERPTAVRALIAGFFYGLHPVMIEPVAWVSSRFDLLAAFFILLALWAESTISQQRNRTLALCACFGAAALCKEMAVTFPALLFLYQRVTRFREQDWKDVLRVAGAQREWRVYGALLLTGLLYLGLRWLCLPRMSDVDQFSSSLLATRPGLHAQYVALTWLFYLRQSLWPFADISPLHPVDILKLTSLQGIGALSLMLTGLALLGWGLLRRSLSLTLFAAATVALLPVLNIIPLRIAGSIGNDRFLVLPLAFVALGIAALPRPEDWGPVRQKILPMFFRALGVLWLGAAVINVRVTLPLWSNEITLWSWYFQKHPDHWYGQHVYLGALVNQNQLDRAGVIFKDLVAKGPLEASVQVVYGSYLIKTGELQEGINYLRGVLDLLPALHKVPGASPDAARFSAPLSQILVSSAYFALSEGYILQKKYADGLDAAEASLFYRSGWAPPLYRKSLALYGLDRPEEADGIFQETIEAQLPDQAQNTVMSREKFLLDLCSGMQAGQHPRTCRRLHDQAIPRN